MPQLDFTTFAPQLIWLAITFLLLYILMARVALPRVGAVIEERRERIEGDLDAARRTKAEIEIVIQAYERTLAEARVRAAATLNATKERLAALAAEGQRQSLAALTVQTRIAETRIEEAKSRALADIRGIATAAAGPAAARLLGEEFDPAEVAAAVDQAIAGGG
jgi:F-type H+-transporting ATPase subunit b